MVLHRYHSLIRISEKVGAGVYIIRHDKIIYASGFETPSEIKMLKWNESHYFIANDKRHYALFTPGYIIKIIVDVKSRGWIDIARTIIDKKLY